MTTLVHEEIYRGGDLLKKMAEQDLLICGAGAIGSNLVENLVRQGFKKITVIDFDRVDDHNRHTQIYDRRDIGQLKVNALKSRIFNIMGVSIEIISQKLEQSNIERVMKKDFLVIDGFDNTESRRLITEYCNGTGKTCLHAGLNRDYAEVVWNQFYRVPDSVKGMDVCEYPLARNVILMAVAVASEVLIKYLDRGVYENYAITLKDLKIREL